MPNTFDRLAGFADAIYGTKRAEVSSATAQKKAEAAGMPYTATAAQAASIPMTHASEQERDFRSMDSLSYAQKYGMKALLGRGDATGQYIGDTTMPRTFSQGAADTVTDIGTGLVNSVGGIAALGAGLATDEGGAFLSQQLGEFNDWSQSTQSPALQAKRAVNAAKNAAASAENKNASIAAIKAGQSPLVAGLSRVGKDIIDSVITAASDSTTLGSGLSQGIGSILAAGPLIKGIGAAGSMAIPKATQAGVGLAAAIDAGAGTMSAARVMNAAAGAAPAAVAIGAMEAGGAYQQTADQVMRTPHNELMMTSPQYRALVDSGVAPAQAKSQLAGQAAKTAAAIQAPIAALTGPLVSKFEQNPFAGGTFGKLATNMVKEGVEEGIQSGTGQLAQNIGVRKNVTPTQDVLAGVGEQAGAGAVYGMGSAGAIQAPAAVRRTLAPIGNATMATARAIGGAVDSVTAPVRDALVKRGEAVDRQNAAASPVSDAKVQSAAADAVFNADTAKATMTEGVNASTATDAEKATAHQYINDLVDAAKFSPSELDQAGMPDAVKAVVANSTTRADAFSKIADFINKTDEGTHDHMAASLALHDMAGQIENFFLREPAALNQVDGAHAANTILDEYSNLVANLGNTPKVSRALRVVGEMLARTEVQPVTDTSLATPEGQQNVKVAIAQAEAVPDKANPQVISQILKHASEGKIQLTGSQRAALQSAAALLSGAREYDAQAKALGLRPQDVVSMQIKTDETRTGEGQQSALQHAKGIRSAYNAGNLDLAAARLDDFMKFAQHMQNKVGALNEHLVSGNADPNRSVKYQALTAQREWVQSKKGLGINPYDAKSVKFAQQVGLEAATVGNIANNLASAYPELSVSHVKLVPLDSRLDKPAAQVVKSFRQGDLAVTQSVEKTEPAAKVEKTPVTETKVAEATVPAKAPVVEQKAEAKQAPTTVEPVTAEKVPEPVKREGIDAVFPDMVGSIDPKASGIKNYFKQAFRLPTEAKTRTITDEAPLASIKSALGSPERLASFIGSNITADMDKGIVSAYKDLMSYGESIANDLRESLSTFLNTKNVGERFAKGEEANRWVEGKLLNIVEPAGDSFAYNESLLQNAVLAALQWQVTAIDRGTIKDAKDAKALTGLEEGEQPSGLIEALNNGLTLTEAVNSLAQKIESYWGFDRVRSAPIGYTRGIPLAMAAEVLQSLVTHGGVEVTRLNISETGVLLEDGAKGIDKTVDIYRPVKQAEDSPLRSYPTAIEEAVMIEPEEKTYFGDERPAVPREQLRNPGVDNTPEQRAALKNEIDTEHRLHQPMVDLLLTGLGQDRILDLMGAGRVNPDLLNVNHALSLEGKNRSLAAGFNHLQGLVAQVSNQVEDITTLPIHYGYNMTRVGRMQMLGKYNPQSTKLVREAVLPTQSTLDLSGENTADMGKFTLGLAQALGVKVHNMSVEASTEKTFKMLNGPLKDSVDMLKDWLPSRGELPAHAVETLKQGLGGDLSFVALHALVEYARYQNADTATRAAFETPLYVEADGVTNGPINAMALMSAGRFTKQWLQNMAKGGLFIGQPNMTMNEYRSTVDGKDLYQASTDELAKNLDRLRKSIAFDPALTQQMSHLQSLMDLFLKDLSITEDGNLELTRGIAKNPLTITIYGSGAKGIAGKMVSQVVDAMYERMSQAVQAMNEDSSVTPAIALFGKQAESPEHAQQMLKRLSDDMTALTSNVPVIRKEQMLLESTDSKGKSRGEFNPQTYTLTGDELRALQTNMLHLFVTPMREGINATIGNSLIESTQQLQKATQVQSLYLQEAFKEAVQAKLAEKEADPTYKPGDFLSQEELDNIQKSFGNLAPMIDTGSQTFYIAGSQSTELGDSKKRYFARTLNGKMPIPLSVYGPAESGVAGIPVMTIGTGDGMMMQTLSTMRGRPTGTLKIFDGMNMKLSTITEDSVKANQAVYESWQGNPLQAVSDSYQKFLKNADFSNMSEALYEGMKRSLLEPKLWKEQVAADYLENAARTLGEQLQESAMQAEARHRALDRVQLSIDQMAAVGAPYQNQGKIDLSALTQDEQVAELNKLMIEEYRKLKNPVVKAEPTASTVEKEKPNMAFDIVGREHVKSGARILSPSAIKNLTKLGNMSAEQAMVLNEIQKSLAAKEYKVIYGTADQVNLYAQLTGKQMLEAADLAEAKKGNIDGWTTFDDKTIYITKPSNETLVHELVHASTFEKVFNHYNGETNPVVNEAIGRIEKLMDQFMKLDVSGQSAEFQSAYTDARMAIDTHLQDGFNEPVMSKAAALNEYMAWGLTNRELVQAQKSTTASPLVQLLKDTYAAIKNLIFGSKLAPKVSNDMFSNLMFNSSIIMRAQPTIAAVKQDGSLFMSRAYGANERVAEMTNTFDRLVSDYLNVAPVDKVTRRAAVDKAVMSSINLVRNVQAHGFFMTAQESALFESAVAAMATEVSIDPQALNRAQELYAHVTKNLKVEHFMVDPESNDPADRYYAQEKYDVVMGNYLVENDAKGRSSLLPTFLGLAMASDDLRSALAKLPVPKVDQKLGNSMDVLLTNAGAKAMETLSRRLAGDHKAQNITEAVDALGATITATSQKSQSLYDSVAVPSGNAIDRANQYIVDSVGRLSDAAIDKADGILKNPESSRAKKVAAEALRLVAAVATEKNGERVARGVMSAMNQGKVWQPFHDLMNDLTGRTKETADVYDMIKGVRSQIQQDRQQFREHLPTTIANKFSRKLTDSEWATLHTALGKTDIASLRETMNMDEIRSLFADQKNVDAQINTLEAQLQQMDAFHYSLLQAKSKQLAKYMITGVTGGNLLRNAEAVSRLFGEKARKGRATPTDTMIKTVDQLTTLYAIEQMSKSERDIMTSLVQSEAEGIDFSTAYMVGQRVDEMTKAHSSDEARFNHYKGHIPVENQQGVNMVVADDTEFSKLSEQSYIRVGDYQGSSADRGRGSQGYYYSPVSVRSPFSQGIMQNVRSTAGGVDTTTGFTQGNMAGRITDKFSVARITKALLNGERGSEPLLPVYDRQGAVVAYERSSDPLQLARLNPDRHFAKAVGVWRGRQVEEAKSQIFNDRLVENLFNRYKEDLIAGRKGEYINVLNGVQDKVLTDALALMNQETKEKAESLFGKGEFWVRRDMLNDSFGYRMASIGDMWTGNSRYEQETQDTIRKMALGVFGNKAYKYVMTTENVIQNLVKDAKTLIVVKSMIVPAVNFVANLYQMAARGVPLKEMVTGLPRKTSEIDSYVKTRLRQVEAEAELRAAEGDVVKTRKLQAEIQSITDSHKRMSIWPLIEAGEFSSISDAGISRDDVLITEGKLHSYMDSLVNKLPESMQNAGRYALITKDTALFQGIQKAVEYSDFIAKALIYDHLTKKQGKSQAEALGRVTEEFINYDRLPGRFRSYMESIGLMWFYNFKIRSAKVAVSMIRNNPLHSLIAGLTPAPTMFGNVGLPIKDNIFSLLVEGKLENSIGIGQGLRAPSLNPWHALVN